MNPPANPSTALWELAKLFLRLGLTAFGGPAAHIAMFRREVVQSRGWLSDEQFLDLLGATNLIPGPNSTEMAIHIGLLRAGWRGLVVAGTCFILPAALLVGGFAWLYVRYSSLPALQWLMTGIQPVIVVIVLEAVWGLSQKVAGNRLHLLAGLVVLGIYLLTGANEIGLLFLAGLSVMLIENVGKASPKNLALVLPGLGLPAFTVLEQAVSLPGIFLNFLKIGSVLYGSGYVLLAFLRADFVLRLHWLSDQQLLDAITIGQITPGPVFTTATFIGYILAGPAGAVAATIGIFLPAFVFVAISQPLIARLRSSAWAGSLLDGVNAASLALMAAVTIQLGQAVLHDFYAILTCLAAAWLIFRYKTNSTWLILGGAMIGLIRFLFSI